MSMRHCMTMCRAVINGETKYIPQEVWDALGLEGPAGKEGWVICALDTPENLRLWWRNEAPDKKQYLDAMHKLRDEINALTDAKLIEILDEAAAGNLSRPDMFLVPELNAIYCALARYVTRSPEERKLNDQDSAAELRSQQEDLMQNAGRHPEKCRQAEINLVAAGTAEMIDDHVAGQINSEASYDPTARWAFTVKGRRATVKERKRVAFFGHQSH
jgi:hypothetical protein